MAESSTAPLDQTCATCKWWKNFDAEWQQPTDEHYLDRDWGLPRERVPGRWGECSKVAEFGPQSPADRFYVVDGSEYVAALYTRDTFGCVEWEKSDG